MGDYLAGEAETYNEFMGEYVVAYGAALRMLHKPCEMRVLDYGCGTGKSTRVLRSVGFQVVGVDKNSELLTIAQSSDHAGIEYHLIDNNDLSSIVGEFDAALSAFVFLEISTKQELEEICREVYEKLKPGGFYVVITKNPDAIGYESDLIRIEPVEGFDGRSGDRVRDTIKTDPPIVFVDYHWTEEDHRQVLEVAGFNIEEICRPISVSGQDVSPFLVIHAVKTP